jgi:hypothetical protein
LPSGIELNYDVDVAVAPDVGAVAIRALEIYVVVLIPN